MVGVVTVPEGKREMDWWATAHIGRSFVGHPLEDDCPCGKAPCGLVDVSLIDAECPQHTIRATKTIRQAHPADRCPGGVS